MASLFICPKSGALARTANKISYHLLVLSGLLYSLFTRGLSFPLYISFSYSVFIILLFLEYKVGGLLRNLTIDICLRNPTIDQFFFDLLRKYIVTIQRPVRYSQNSKMHYASEMSYASRSPAIYMESLDESELSDNDEIVCFPSETGIVTDEKDINENDLADIQPMDYALQVFNPTFML